MGKIHWIGIDGTETIEEAAEEPSLEQLQDFVGGFIELIPIKYNGKRASMYVNEEANLHALERNPTASEILKEAAREMGRPLQPGFPGILGPAIILEDIHPA